MSPTVITLIAWAPFLLLAVIFGVTFSLLGYKRGAARAGISVGFTVVSCLLALLFSKLISSVIAGAVSPVLSGALSGAGLELAASELASIATSLAGALSAFLLFVPMFIIFSLICKLVSSAIFKNIIPEPNHIANKLGGIGVSVIDALLVAFLITLPIYGTLSLAEDVTSVVTVKGEAGDYISAATEPFIVDVAGAPPFSTVYDSLLTCKVGSSELCLSATVREGAEIAGDFLALGDIKGGEFNSSAAVSLLGTAEKFLTENELFTDIACEFIAKQPLKVTLPGVGKIDLVEYYPALSDSDMLRQDLPALFDLFEATVDSGMLNAVLSEDGNMTYVDADRMSKALGGMLNNSPAIATLKSKLMSDMVSALTKDAESDGSLDELLEAVSSIPSEPLPHELADKEGEAFYLIVSGAVTTSKDKKNEIKGLGMVLEGFARHPSIGTDRVVSAAGTFISGAGIKASDSLISKISENLALSVSKPIGQSTFPNYCDTAIKATNALTGLTGGSNGGSSKPNPDGGEKPDPDGGEDTSTPTTNESLKELIVADKDSLEAVKDTVSTDLMVDLGIDKEHTETFKTVVDATFDAIIEEECTAEEAEKEAESLGNILEVVTDVTTEPEKANDIFEERTEEFIDYCLDSRVVTSVVTTLTKNGESDPLDIFSEVDEDTRDKVESKIDEYIENTTDDKEIEILEALKLFVGIE